MARLPITEESFNGYKVPGHMHEGIIGYINRGDQNLGGFLEAFLDNDLKGAFARADTINAHNMIHTVSWFWNEAPVGCWGGKERREIWQANGGAVGLGLCKEGAAP